MRTALETANLIGSGLYGVDAKQAGKTCYVIEVNDTWQLVINTSTTIITFLMVFLIQHTQNRDTEAMQIKLDELIRATRGAHNAMLELEALDEEQ